MTERRDARRSVFCVALLLALYAGAAIYNAYCLATCEFSVWVFLSMLFDLWMLFEARKDERKIDGLEAELSHRALVRLAEEKEP